MPLNFDTFCKYMNKVVSMIHFSDDVNKLCREYKYNDYNELSFPTMICDVIDLLGIALEDENEWIAYWVFDLDCGEKYHDGMVTDTDGGIIRLKTVEDLWKLLIGKYSVYTQEKE